MTQPVLTIDQLHQTFEKGTINENHVLKGIDLTMNHG
ncbi:MAG TPA: ABC transporter ATP-binding protein, partial [Enterococcus sp.]|nr:ABC transporter ATP-binding protein [Enterococcus sp.]